MSDGLSVDEWIDKILKDLAYKAPELWDGYLRACLRTAISQNLPEPPAEQFVVVTVTDNGVIHAYGGGEAGTPFADRMDATKLASQIRREDQAMRPRENPVVTKTCKVLGSTNAPVDGGTAA